MDFETIKDKIEPFISYLKHCRRFIKRLYAWIPILWKDEDWDSAYLYEIMAFKISRLRKDMEESARHLGYEKDVHNMKIAENLLQRQGLSDFYYDNDEKNRQYCECPDDKFSFGNSLFVNHLCNWCSRKTQLSRQNKKEKEDYDFMWKHIGKHSKRWWN